MMEERKISSIIMDEKYIIKTFESYVLTNKKPLILYVFLYFLLLYLIINSIQEIIGSRLISFIISVYLKDKLTVATIFMGLAGALALLLGHISSENEEKINGREGKILSGIAFLQNKIATFSGLILLIFFYIAYYKTFNWIEFGIFFLLVVIFSILWLHFDINLHNVYDWDTLENFTYKISLNILLGEMAFQIGLLFYIYSLQYVNTLILNILNMWVLFLSIIVSASLKYSRSKKSIVKYSDSREEYAHLVRIENGFAILITRNCESKQINLSEIKEINYDKDYIENFKRTLN